MLFTCLAGSWSRKMPAPMARSISATDRWGCWLWLGFGAGILESLREAAGLEELVGREARIMDSSGMGMQPAVTIFFVVFDGWLSKLLGISEYVCPYMWWAPLQYNLFPTWWLRITLVLLSLPLCDLFWKLRILAKYIIRHLGPRLKSIRYNLDSLRIFIQSVKLVQIIPKINQVWGYYKMYL